MPIRPGRESAAVVATAVVGLLLVLSGLYAHIDDAPPPIGLRVARAIDLDRESADPGPPVEAPEPESRPAAPPTPEGEPPAEPTEAASPPPSAAAALVSLQVIAVALETAASSTATAAPPTPSPASASPRGAPRQAARAAPGAPVPILMYHYIRVNPDPADTIGYGLSTPPPLFAAQMDFLLERGYRVVPMRRLEELLGSGRLPDEKTVVVTLDDGYRDAYTEAFPVLRSHDFGATIFVITDLIDNPRYLSVGQLKELSAAGIEIGSHSATHSDLPSLSPQRLRREVVDSRAALERILGGPVTSFCYPSGRNNLAVRAAVREAGYASALTVEPGLFRGREDRFAIPRVRVYGGMGIASLARAIGEPAPDPATWRAFLNDAPQPRLR